MKKKELEYKSVILRINTDIDVNRCWEFKYFTERHIPKATYDVLLNRTSF